MSAKTRPLLEVRGLETRFDTDAGPVRAVNGIDLRLRRGETLCLVGESGSGKSVAALSIIRLIEAPGRIVAGEILFEGQDLLHLPEPAMDALRGARIAMIFQEPMTALDPVQRVGEQIAEGPRLHRGLTRRAARACAVELLSKVGVPDPERRARAYPHELSGGLRQRVMIAAAIACGPDLIIADEPTTALDVTIQAQILALMRSMQEETGSGVLLITHDLGVVAEVAARVAVMYAGCIVEEASVTEIFASPAHPYTRGLLACVPDVEAAVAPGSELPAIPGTVPAPHAVSAGCRFRDRCAHAFDRCANEPPLLRLQPDHAVRCWLHAR